jgi:hypothetical protein
MEPSQTSRESGAKAPFCGQCQMSRLKPRPTRIALSENLVIIAGRGFSHDLRPAKSVRLQPLRFQFFSSHSDSKARLVINLGVAAEQATERLLLRVIPSEARNLS